MLIVTFLFTTRLSSQIQVFNFFFSANLSKPGIQLLNSEFVSDLEFSFSNPGSDLIFSFSNPGSDLEFSFSNPGLFEFQVWNKPGIEKLNSRFTLKSPVSRILDIAHLGWPYFIDRSYACLPHLWRCLAVWSMYIVYTRNIIPNPSYSSFLNKPKRLWCKNHAKFAL